MIFLTKLTRHLLFSLLFVAPISFAAIHLELTQGTEAKLPIQIEASVINKKDSANRNHRDALIAKSRLLRSIIAHDLHNSGHFRDLSANEDTHQAQYRLIMKVSLLPQGKYHVHSKLLALYDQQPILWKKDNNITPKQLRRLAHRLSDNVYQSILGIKGYFSTRIAYITVEKFNKNNKTYTLEIADVDGYNSKKLLISKEPIMSPSWSKDGRFLAYVSFEGHRSAIYKQKISTGKRVKIAHFSGINGAPAWHPDGKHLAIVLSKKGSPTIYLINISKKSPHALLPTRAIDTEPVWFADGKSFLFTSNREGNPQIYRYWLNTKQIKRITFSGSYNAKPSLSKNNQLMAFLHKEGRLFTIAVMNLQSNETHILTSPGFYDSPSISGNGQAIIYAEQRKRNNMLNIVSTDGQIKIRLPAKHGSVQTPAWSLH